MQIIGAQIHLRPAGLPRNPRHWPVTQFSAEEAMALMDEGTVDARSSSADATELALKAMQD
jgi:hypothetical protein